MLHVSVYPDVNPYYLSYFYSGLVELAESGKIRLSYDLFLGSHLKNEPEVGSVALYMSVSDEDSTRTICYDHHDKTYLFAFNKLEHSDIYFKRSYDQSEIDKLPHELARKIKPYGFDYPVKTKFDGSGFLRTLAFYLKNYFSLTSPKASINGIRNSLFYWNSFRKSPTIEEFEQSPQSPLKPQVFYQTRIYAPDETSDNTNINKWRLSIIEALKAELGDQFLGGVVPTDYTRKYCPEFLTNHQTDRVTFTHLMRSSLINVHTRGLHYSTSWKLGEYIAASVCIVAEAPYNLHPVALEDGKHFLGFRSPDECVDVCKTLLNNTQLATQMRQNNWNYYLKEIHPKQRVLYCLNYGE